jgi:polysaccharide deacetylase 2 family uncharacterized protein YibQ
MFAANVFAKRPLAATGSAPAVANPRLPGFLNHPFALPAAAAGFLLLSIGLFVLATNDPHAGAPSVKVALQTAAKPGEPGALRPGLPGDPANPTLNSLPPGQDVGMAGAPDPLMTQFQAAPPSGGQAVVTLPQGATLSGGQPALPPRPKAQPLAQAPIAGLTAQGPGGLLPIIGKDGRTPFQAYARPFASNGKPKIAIVVGGLGLNGASTRAAIEKLPPEITLSFVPYADGLQGWVDLARANGHEVVLELPMEPLDYPANDPGKYTLMTNAAPAETVRRLEWLLARTTGYFATTNYMGGRFVTSDSAMTTLVTALKARGLGFLDDGSASRRGMVGAPRASADAVIDDQLSSEDIERQLTKLEGQALAHGQALGAGFGYPVTVEQVTRWAAALAGRGYQLAPASAVMRK